MSALPYDQITPKIKYMSVEIRQVSSRKELKTFVEFQNHLYKGNPYFVPKLFMDEMNTLDPGKNPAYEFSDAAMYLAYRDGEVVGRVAAIVNKRANEKWDHREVRFGWIDFVDDYEVSGALLDKVVAFGKERGMDRLVGPLGFTDFDPEGMLVEGYDKLCTMALIYNYPYYVDHIKHYGLSEVVEWVEYNVYVPDQLPERVTRIANLCKKRYNLRIRLMTKSEIKKEKLGRKIFEIINESYADLYNFTILPDNLIDKYVDSYLGFLDLRLVPLVVDENDNMVGFAITMPSITRALQKCGGKLFPFGWFYILRSLFWKREPNVEMLLVAAKKENQNQGVLAIIFDYVIPVYKELGFKYGESNAELVSNTNIQSPWSMFENEIVKRRKIFGKDI